MTIQLHMGDCLEVMPRVAAGSVDLILADLPYGTTACAWDSVIPMDALWQAYRRVLRPGGVVVLTAAQPFNRRFVLTAATPVVPEHIGIKHTAEARANMSAAQKGREVSAEHRKKISETLKGRVIPPDQYARYLAAMTDGEVWKRIGAKRRGTVASAETRAKQSIAQRGRKHSEETKAKISAANQRRKAVA